MTGGRQTRFCKEFFRFPLAAEAARGYLFLMAGDPRQKATAAAMTAAAARTRIERIRACEAELAELAAAGTLVLTDAQREALERHHAALLQKVSAAIADAGDTRGALPLAMRVTAFFGALFLAASLFFFFFRIWGVLAAPVQALLLAVAPVAGLIGAEIAARRDPSGYFTALAALLSFAALQLNLGGLGELFNISASPLALLALAGYAFILAYGYSLRLLLLAGLVCLSGFISGQIGALSGCMWEEFGRRQENFLASGLVILALAALVPSRRHPGFTVIYRSYGLLATLVSLLFLSLSGDGSYLHLDRALIERGYQVAGLAASALAVWAGLRRGWRETVNLGSLFFALFLYLKYYDAWWDTFPKYLFFFIAGLSALGLLLLFKKLRRRMAGSAL
jgi:hypothetical protein